MTVTAVIDRAAVETAARAAQVELPHGGKRPLVIDEWAMLSALLDDKIFPAAPGQHCRAIIDLSREAFGTIDTSKTRLVLARLASAGLITFKVSNHRSTALIGFNTGGIT